MVRIDTLIYHANDSACEGHPFMLRVTFPESIVFDVDAFPPDTNYTIVGVTDALTTAGREILSLVFACLMVTETLRGKL